MAVSELIQRLVGRRKEREQQARQTFDEVVRTLADGETIDDHEIDAMLEACGKSPESLQTAVDILIERREAAAKLDEAKALRPRIKELEDEQARLADERNEFVKKCNARIVAANAECDALRHNANQAENAARRTLLQSAPASIAERTADIHARRAPLAKRQTRLREQLQEGARDPISPAGEYLRARRRLERLEHSGIRSGEQFQSASANAERLQAIVGAIRAELAGVNEQLAALDAETQAVEAEKFVA